MMATVKTKISSMGRSKMVANLTIYFALFALIIFFSLTTSGFLTFSNVMNILRQVAVNGIAAAGMTFVILTGGIDISVGAIMGLSGIGAATLMLHGVHPVVAVVAMLALGLLVGCFNGIFVFSVGLPPMIATLSTMSILRGLAYIISGGLPVSPLPAGFKWLGQGYIGPVPVPVVILAICFAAGWFVLTKTSFGRHVYGIGSNQEASRLCGINVRKVMLSVYAICGLLSALAGVVLLSRVNSGQPNAGETYEMDIITAIVMGGVSTTGGEGRITNVMVGLVFMGVLLNGMMMKNVPDYYQRVVKGCVLLLAISYDKISQKRAKRIA